MPKLKNEKSRTVKPKRAARGENYNPIAASVKRLYNKSAPLLICEALLFGVVAILMVVKPVAILTNTTTLHIESVYNTLLLFDIVVPSLDSVDSNSFNKINLPDKNINIENIISSLEKFSHEYKGRLFVEVLFCKGVNDDKKSIEKLINVLKNIKAEKVQLGTIHRPPAYKNIEKVDDEFLLATANLLKNNNINAEVTGGFVSLYKTSATLNLDELIPSLLKMRPCTLQDMSCVFGKSENEINEALNILIEKNIIKASFYNDDTYYTL